MDIRQQIEGHLAAARAIRKKIEQEKSWRKGDKKIDEQLLACIEHLQSAAALIATAPLILLKAIRGK